MRSEATENGTTANRRGADWAVVTFFVIAYAVAWGAFGVMSFAAGRLSIAETAAFMGRVEALDFGPDPGELLLPSWALYALSRVADFSFSIAGVVMIAWTAGKVGLRDLLDRLTRWRISPKWYLAACAPLFFYAAASALAAANDTAVGESLDVSGRAWAAALFGAQTGIVFHLLFRGSMGEELGLRGFALPRLQGRYGPVGASLVIGLFWYLWHLPVLLGRGPVELALYGVLVMLLSFIFTWLYNGSGGSLLPGLLFHAIQNSEDAFERLMPALKGTDWEGPSSLALLVFGLAVTTLIVRSARRRNAEAVA